MTLGDSLSGRDNALNFGRLLLAIGVVISHTWPLGGFGDEPRFGGQTLGSWCVAGFFAISGYLIPLSRQRQSLGRYVAKRCLRILPALWVCLAFIAFGFAPLAAAITRVDYHPPAAAEYFWANAGTLYARTHVGNELANLPFPNAWNGSLWTLQWEVLCYVIAGLSLSRSSSRIGQVVPAVGVLAIGTLAGGPFFSLLAYFGAGWLLACYRHSLHVSGRLAVASGVTLAVVTIFGAPFPLGALPLSYLLLAFGAASPVRWGQARDLSYGLYIFAFPVQQLIALTHLQRAGWLASLVTSLSVTLLLAWWSWTFVEAPALKLAQQCRIGRASNRAPRSQFGGPDCAAPRVGPLNRRAGDTLGG